jgi:hypothetical protein
MTVSDVERVANAIAKGGLFGSKDPYAVLTLCLLAQAEGQHPAVVFRDYHIIQGKPAKKAEAMLRDFINAGGKVEWHRLDDECADATFSHPAGTARISWDTARVKKAQLGGNAMHAKYPRQMLRSRVISEGVRTVYPGATSGLYEEGEVASFDPPPVQDGLTQHDPQTGEIIEGETVERQKVPGIHKIKQRLRAMQAECEKAQSLEEFNAIISANKDDLQTIKDANHEWWTGDSEDFEGFKAFIKGYRETLAPKQESLTYQLLVSTLQELRTYDEYLTWFGKHGDAVGELDGEESRHFEGLHDAKVSALKSPTPLEVGAFGG